MALYNKMCLNLFCSTFLYLMFVLILGATCQRAILLTDFMIAAKVSAISEFPYILKPR